MSPRKTLEDIVFENGLTDILRLERARRESASRNVSLAATLIDLGYVEQHALARVVAAVTGCPLVDPLPEDDAARLQSRLPAALAREAMAAPVALEGTRLVVVMLDPTLEDAIAALAETSGLEIVPAVGVREPLEALVDRLYPEYQGEDITLMAGLGLSLDTGNDDAADEPPPFGESQSEATVAAPPDDRGTVMVAGAKRKSGDTTAPRGSRPGRSVEARVAAAEARLLDVVRILADVQARLDAIEARLRRLPDS